MKITRGFVAVLPDGQFLYISNQQTHTGQHITLSPVADIDDASVRNNPAPRDRKEAAALASRNVAWVPVEVQRHVALQGYGVAREA